MILALKREILVDIFVWSTTTITLGHRKLILCLAQTHVFKTLRYFCLFYSIFSAFNFYFSLPKFYFCTLSLFNSVWNTNKQIMKTVAEFIQDFLTLKRAALFKGRGALNLIGYFMITTWKLLWGKILTAVIFLTILFEQWHRKPHSHTYWALCTTWLQIIPEGLKSNMKVGENTKR